MQKLGIKISRIDVGSFELERIRFHRTKEAMHYLANCNDGMIMATFCSKSNTISCKKRIFCLSDGAEGVYQQYSERQIDDGHYHLLRLLYEVQAAKESKSSSEN